MGRSQICGMLYRIIAIAALIFVGHFASAAQTLIYNGDFELKSDEQPPPGWTMWGAQRYKNRANYTRDTASPHSGDACFRIHHPADTAGYIVSSPAHAIRPKKGMMYTVSFWSRTDRPGTSQFYFTAYETIAPYKDAPSAGRWNIDVGQQWQRHEFQVHEGWDFFSARSRYLLLTFRATGNMSEQKTLWIDDVAVLEQPSDRQGRMIDETQLEYEPLQHRLERGEQLRFTVDAQRHMRPAAHRVGGISFHRVAGWTGQPYDREGNYTLHPKIEEAIRQLQLPMTRFYAVGDEPFSVEAAIDRIAALLEKVDIPQQTTVLELEIQGATSKLPAEVWARAARHCVQKGYAFHHWEIANEPYLTRPGTAFAEPEDYITHVRAVSAAIREAQPGAEIGVAIHRRSQPWGNRVLKQTAGCYEFVVGHYYGVRDIHRRKFEVATLTENYRILDRLLQISALMDAYNPDREVYQLDTEWGMHSSGPEGERADYVDRNANIWGTIYRAVRLIYYVREGMLRGASSWQMLNKVRAQGFGILAQQQPDKRFMLYWLYYYFNRHVGKHVLNIEGTAPWYTPAEGDDPYTKAGEYPGPLTPAVVTASADGHQLYLIAANGSWDRAVPCRMELQSFEAADATGTIISHSQPDGKPLLEKKGDAVSDLPLQVRPHRLTCTLPPHSVVFITIEGQ